MKHEDAMKLELNQKMIHRRYGICIVNDILVDNAQDISIEKALAEPGEKPIDHETAWGIPEDALPEQESKNYFDPKYEDLLP